MKTISGHIAALWRITLCSSITLLSLLITAWFAARIYLWSGGSLELAIPAFGLAPPLLLATAAAVGGATGMYVLRSFPLAVASVATGVAAFGLIFGRGNVTFELAGMVYGGAFGYESVGHAQVWLPLMIGTPGAALGLVAIRQIGGGTGITLRRATAIAGMFVACLVLFMCTYVPVVRQEIRVFEVQDRRMAQMSKSLTASQDRVKALEAKHGVF